MANDIKTLSDHGSIFPGNALGSVPIPQFPNSSQSTLVGAGAKEVSWSQWIQDIGNDAYKLVNPAAAIMPTASEIAKTAATETSDFVSSSVNKVVGAATGLGTGVTDFLSGFKDTIKYLAWALMAAAVLYVAATLVVPAVAAGKR